MKITKYIKVIQKNNFSLVTYFFLVVIRIILVFIPQIGYIHPDEFFQSSEVVLGEFYIFSIFSIDFRSFSNSNHTHCLF